jgi:hypothetical protein
MEQYPFHIKQENQRIDQPINVNFHVGHENKFGYKEPQPQPQPQPQQVFNYGEQETRNDYMPTSSSYPNPMITNSAQQEQPKKKKGAITSLEDKEKLVNKFNEIYDEIIVSYLKSIKYNETLRAKEDGADRVETLRTHLKNKFTKDVEGKTFNGMVKTIRAYLKSLKKLISCINEKYNTQYEYSLGNPALLTRRINVAINKILTEMPGSAVLINNKTFRTYCEEISKDIKHDIDGGSRSRHSTKKRTQKRRRYKSKGYGRTIRRTRKFHRS